MKDKLHSAEGQTRTSRLTTQSSKDCTASSSVLASREWTVKTVRIAASSATGEVMLCGIELGGVKEPGSVWILISVCIVAFWLRFLSEPFHR